MENDWQTLTSLAETNLKMLELEIMCDVTFLVGNEKKPIKAHKFMLVSRSPVFYAMFYGPLAESRDSIEVPDIKVECFKCMLRFIYTADCLVTADVVMSLLYTAKKYGIVGLVIKCKDYLKSELSAENVCVILHQAHMFDEQDLLKQCLSFVCKNGSTVLKSSGFLCLPKDTLSMILASDDLETQEDEVYSACLKWAEEECKRGEKNVNYTSSREALGDLVYLIRFPCMNLDKFTSLIAEGGLLTAEENMSIVLQLTQKKTSPFNSKSRQYYRHLDSYLMERFNRRSQYAQEHKNELLNAISFSCSENVRLAGVSLYMPCSSKQIQGILECYEKDRCLVSTKIDLSYDGNTCSVRKLFDTPVDIRKFTTYTLTQTITGGSTYKGERGQNCVKKHGIEIRFFKSDKDTNSNDAETGQFHGLIFL